MQITNIAVEKLLPHPKNPRLELGDLAELIDSIRENGIMQNLTVIPFNGVDGRYTVIIGHRRLAAAKLAGLTEVPCVVTEMTEKEQISTMLLENMQRSDLTVYEQAQGIQMMFDMGIAVNEIAESTGFSEITIRRRMKIASLGEKVKELPQVSLEDFVRVSEIEDEEERNKLMGYAGTTNFEWALKRAQDSQKRAKKKVDFIGKLREICSGGELDDIEGYNPVKTFYDFTKSDYEALPDDFAETEYYFSAQEDRSWIYLVRKYTAAEKQQIQDKNKKDEKEEQWKAEVEPQLQALSKTAYELRRKFVMEYGNAKGHLSEIVEWLVETLKEGGSYYFDKDFDELGGLCERHKTLLLLWYSHYGDGDERNYRSYYDHWNCKHKKNEELDTLYDRLQQLGYAMSDEEKQLQDGTHPLFVEEAV
jgi:ParB family chromosome partitioning protein